MQDRIYHKIQKYTEENNMFLQAGAVLAGVSGGGDSMAMLDMLIRLSEAQGFFLQVIHVNHMIRGQEAERDQKLVEEVCRKKGISCQVYVRDVPGLAARLGIGLEEAGRMARKEAFLAAGSRLEEKTGGGGRILTALAHNKNDLAETMLHHLARGTGIRGLSSMKPVNGELIRPLLCLERREIDEYLKERQIPYALDGTNLEDDYTRNRIRHHIIPAMEKEINAKAVSHMAETAAILEMAEEYLSGMGRGLLRSCGTEEGFLFREDFFENEKILQTYAVREALEEIAGQRKDLALIHINAVLDLWNGRTGSCADLPRGIEAVRRYEGVLLRKKAPEDKAGTLLRGSSWQIPVPGVLECPFGIFRTKIFSYSGEKILEKKYTKWMDCDKIKYGLTVRARRSGDYLVINQAGNKKKLTRCMIDDKIPGELRENIPLVAVGNEVLWIVGGRMSGSCRITSGTARVLQIEYQEK